MAGRVRILDRSPAVGQVCRALAGLAGGTGFSSRHYRNYPFRCLSVLRHGVRYPTMAQTKGIARAGSLRHNRGPLTVSPRGQERRVRVPRCSDPGLSRTGQGPPRPPERSGSECR